MRLSELEPKFVRMVEAGTRSWFETVQTLAGAHGVKHLCPVCFLKNDGPQGTHSIITPNRNAPPAWATAGGWDMGGTGLEDLTVDPSIQVLGEGSCKAHFFIKDGEIKFA